MSVLVTRLNPYRNDSKKMSIVKTSDAAVGSAPTPVLLPAVRRAQSQRQSSTRTTCSGTAAEPFVLGYLPHTVRCLRLPTRKAIGSGILFHDFKIACTGPCLSFPQTLFRTIHERTYPGRGLRGDDPEDRWQRRFASVVKCALWVISVRSSLSRRGGA